MKYKHFLILFVLIALIVLFVSCESKNGLIKIGIVQVAEDPALDRGREGLIKSLTDSGFVVGKNINLDYQNAQGDISNVIQILQSFKSNDVDIVLTLGTPCAVSAAQIINNKPVVYSVAFSPQQMGVKNVPTNITGCYDPLNMAQLIDLMKTIVPNLKRIGIIHNTSEPNAMYGKQRLEIECKNQHIEYLTAPVTSSSEVLQAAQSLVNKDIDAFTIVADNLVYIGISSIVKVANEQKIPIFVSDPIQVEKGAIAGIGNDYYDWGVESGKIAAQILKGKKPEDFKAVPLTNYDIYLNLTVSKNIDIFLDSALIKRAKKLF